MKSSTPLDEAMMRRAMRLAARGQGFVEPNPMVGCVIVKRGRVIGEGWHRQFGGPHAEVDALRRCKESPRGATVYVNLEPCCIFGKTPPCTDALIDAGVKRVVAAMHDPNPRIAGRGLKQLRKAGIAVENGVMEAEASWLNAPFIKFMTQKRPWVILKWAQSLDGKIATRTGDSKWISGSESRKHAHATRGRVDAIVVGVNTVIADDPMLTCRDAPVKRVATRVVLDSRLRTPLRAQLVRTAKRIPTWIFHTPHAPGAREAALAKAGCRLIKVPLEPLLVRRENPTRGSRASLSAVSLPPLLETLHTEGFSNVLVEGGAAALGSFLDAGLADEVHTYVAPLLIGGRDATAALGGRGPARVNAARRFIGPPTWENLGSCWLVSGRLCPSVGSR
jgi:diaminohydroxyphosphoribosylaminopyrimidine deaminase/5-amino-6-(5-phosphoribosylamino)uracil reductase